MKASNGQQKEFDLSSSRKRKGNAGVTGKRNFVEKSNNDKISRQRKLALRWSHEDVAGFDVLAFVAVLFLAGITMFTISRVPVFNRTAPASTLSVFYHGWITALSTGVGAVPFVFVKSLRPFWAGISNAVASGMMLSASMSLVQEALRQKNMSDESNTVHTVLGILLGVVFMKLSAKVIDSLYQGDRGYSTVFGSSSVDARKMLLIIFVMTLHSFTEGVAIGVSFGAQNGKHLGVFISASLAVHNVPEGLAVALVMIPRGVSKLRTALWAVFTSLPQPIMAVPAYLFVETFLPILPVGLGFAAGAMLCVCVYELYPESVEATESTIVTTGVIFFSSILMMYVQYVLA